MSESPVPDLARAIAATLAHTPDGPAVEFGGSWRSWSSLAAIVAGLDRLLAEGGIGEAPVGLVLRNHPSTYAALLGLVATRRCAVLISPFQSPAAIAADIGRLSPVAIVALAPDWEAPDWEAPAVTEAARSIGALGIALTEDARGSASLVPGLAAVDPAVPREPLPEVAVQMLTSGTTGVPKRLPLPRDGLSRAIADQIRLAALMGEAPASGGPAATLVQYAPMVQLSGLYNALQAGAEGRRLVMLEKFSAAGWLASVRVHRQSMLALPPAMMRMVLEAAPARGDLSSLVAVRSGAAPLDADTRERFEREYGIPVLGIYGATEFVGPIASWSLDDHARYGKEKAGSVGRLWPAIAEGRIVEPESGRPTAPGESGLLEVLVPRAGPGWIRTNDLATLDADGFLFIHGRADDAINRGGFKIPPDVIADALRLHPQVYDAAVIPLPDARLGQVPGAAVELRPGTAPVGEADLLEFARLRLLAYQVPVRILVVDALPRTPAQKISRPGVRALFGIGDS